MKKPFDRILFWDDQRIRTPAEHMACDEALADAGAVPVLRTYRWAEPAVTFGYSQRVQNVQNFAKSRPAMRRWTGGGLVIHGADLTLGLWIPSSVDFALLTSPQIYQAIHEAFLPAIRKILPTAKLVSPNDCKCGPVCFESPVAHDIVSDAHKILGGAMRRSRSGVLYQGSLQAAVPEISLAEALADSAWPLVDVSPIEESASVLIRERYSQPAWLNLR